MCQRCNYSELMGKNSVDATPNRLRVIEVIGGNTAPMGARDIFTTVSRTADINRVTVYRILDLLVEKGLVERLKGGGRSLVYGMAPNENHPAHPHFQCTRCDALQCLQPASFNVDIKDMERSFAGEISSVEVRVTGICRNCLRKEPARRKTKKGGADTPV